MLCSYRIDISSLFQVQCLPPVVVQDHWSSRWREGNDTKSKNLQIYLSIYLFIHLIMLHILFVNNLLAYILPCWLFCTLCFRGRAVAYVGRTCSPTHLFVLIMHKGNKICLYSYYTYLGTIPASWYKGEVLCSRCKTKTCLSNQIVTNETNSHISRNSIFRQ